MSVALIRKALETALNGIDPSIDTAWENASFTPPNSSTPYQEVNTLFARPFNAEVASNHQELGYMQVKLMYPLKVGTAAVSARAELLRSTFTRGNSFTNGGVTVNITDTAEVLPGIVDDGRFAVIVKIRFRSFIPN